jgi:hypothetical protein
MGYIDIIAWTKMLGNPIIRCSSSRQALRFSGCRQRPQRKSSAPEDLCELRLTWPPGRRSSSSSIALGQVAGVVTRLRFAATNVVDQQGALPGARASGRGARDEVFPVRRYKDSSSSLIR